jgi:hypothetical protein
MVRSISSYYKVLKRPDICFETGKTFVLKQVRHFITTRAPNWMTQNGLISGLAFRFRPSQWRIDLRQARGTHVHQHEYLAIQVILTS